MKIKEFVPSLLEVIKKTQKDDTLELEIIFKTLITSELFDRVIQRVKGIPAIKLQPSNETLDIFLRDSDVRYTVKGSSNISYYCKNNNLSDLKEGSVDIIRKKFVNKIDMNEYNVRFNLKEEKTIDAVYPKEWFKLDKYFRYKKRFSYITNDNLFSFDFTILKTSKKEIKSKKNEKMKKKEISSFLKKFVIKPKNIVRFDDWWDKLGANDIVEVRGKKYEEYSYSKKFINSEILDSDIQYEIELEWIGNKIKYNSKYESILGLIVENMGIILQAIQKSNFLISNSEINVVKNEYKKLTGTAKFSAPQNVTLELQHIGKQNYVDYQNILSIRRNYSVTEKADGERNIFIVLSSGDVYLINRKNEIKSLGCKLEGYGGTILDGELILKDKKNKNIILFAVFDIYYLKNKDKRSLIFNRTRVQKEENTIKESREEILVDMFKDIKLKPYNKGNNIMIIKKEFYYGNQGTYDRETEEEITKLESSLVTLDKADETYKKIEKQIQNLTQDTKIFEESKRVLDKEYIYKTDGLVFTPVNLVIGDEQDGSPAVFGGRWNKLFKWKPPEENTIDFRVYIKQDNGEDVVNYRNMNGSVIVYKTLILSVGYSSEIHTKYNACRVMNEDLNFSSEYSIVPFQPYNPYIKNIELAYIPIKNNALFTGDNQVIKNNMIIEFSYDSKMGEGFCWKPLRIRNNQMPNDFVTAINVWRTIHNPITKDVIKSGDIKHTNSEVYYFGTANRRIRQTKPMGDFHSFVKKKLLKSVSQKGSRLIDFSCGKGGDINHWEDSGLALVFGLDINRDNLENINNGLCNRILTKKDKQKSILMDNVLACWADSSKLLSNNTAGKDDLNRYYLDVVYGNVDKQIVKNSKLIKFYNIGTNGFDIGSSQFSFHYFFENKIKIETFLRNVSQSLKKGGKFIGTCLDGKKVFELLRGTEDISVFNGETLLWKINKLYKADSLRDDETSVGLPVDIYVESIGNTTTEWLVNFDYIKEKALEFNLELKEVIDFESYFSDAKKQKYGDTQKMNTKLMTYSFLNVTFVFEKK